MRRGLTSFVLAAALVLVMSSGAWAGSLIPFDLEVHGKYWFSTLDSTLKVSSGSTAGTEIKPVDDLGMKQASFPEILIIAGTNDFRARYGYTPLKWSGSKTLSQSFIFAGKTYTASTTVDSKLDVAFHRIGLEYYLLNNFVGKLGLLAELKYLNIDTSIKSAGLNLDESKKITAPIPTLGVLGQVSIIPLIEVVGEISGMTTGGLGGVDAKVIDFDAAVNIKPIPFFRISAGYKMFLLNVQTDSNATGGASNKADLSISGPYAALKFVF